MIPFEIESFPFTPNSMLQEYSPTSMADRFTKVVRLAQIQAIFPNQPFTLESANRLALKIESIIPKKQVIISGEPHEDISSLSLRTHHNPNLRRNALGAAIRGSTE